MVIQKLYSWGVYYGILLITFPKKILKYVKSQTPAQLKDNIFRLTSNGFTKSEIHQILKPKQIVLLVSKLKECNNKDEIFELGMSYIENVYGSFFSEWENPRNLDTIYYSKNFKHKLQRDQSE